MFFGYILLCSHDFREVLKRDLEAVLRHGRSTQLLSRLLHYLVDHALLSEGVCTRTEFALTVENLS